MRKHVRFRGILVNPRLAFRFIAFERGVMHLVIAMQTPQHFKCPDLSAFRCRMKKIGVYPQNLHAGVRTALREIAN